VSWFSLVIGQNTSRQLATSSENLVASAQFLVALVTSESQSQALQIQNAKKQRKLITQNLTPNTKLKAQTNLTNSGTYIL